MSAYLGHLVRIVGLEVNDNQMPTVIQIKLDFSNSVQTTSVLDYLDWSIEGEYTSCYVIDHEHVPTYQIFTRRGFVDTPSGITIDGGALDFTYSTDPVAAGIGSYLSTRFRPIDSTTGQHGNLKILAERVLHSYSPEWVHNDECVGINYYAGSFSGEVQSTSQLDFTDSVVAHDAFGRTASYIADGWHTFPGYALIGYKRSDLP